MSQCSHRLGASEPGNQIAATSPNISIGGDQYDFRPARCEDAPDVLEHSIDVGSKCIPHRRLGQIMALEFRYHGREGKDLELSALEGFAARS